LFVVQTAGACAVNYGAVCVPLCHACLSAMHLCILMPMAGVCQYGVAERHWGREGARMHAGCPG
jgi:hypothetical protein